MKEKILIIDDDLETLRLVGLMLQRQGYEIISANNGEVGINLAKKDKPDLIVLDVMMPDMDGFNVTRQLRANNDFANTPILMFTAKGQVDDKVAGFESGADDYLIKPVHPVELVAHIKALLARRKRETGSLNKATKAYVIGVISNKGGLGVSTIALNLGVTLHDKIKSEIICAEILPNKGTWSLELGLPDTHTLNKVIQKKAEDIDVPFIRQNIHRTSFGINLLLSSPSLVSQGAKVDYDQLAAVVNHLSTSCQILILDLGSGCMEVIEKLVDLCDNVIVVTEAQPTAIKRTKFLLDDFARRGYVDSKQVDILVNNRTRADVQYSITQIQEKLGYQPAIVIPPSPELAYQAVVNNQPLIKVQTGGLLNQQFLRFGEHVLANINK